MFLFPLLSLIIKCGFNISNVILIFLSCLIQSPCECAVLVNTLWKEGKPDEAILAVEQMERRGVVGSAALYYDLARCLCAAGRPQQALLQVC